MTKQLRVYFVDILGAIEEIEEFTRNLTFDEVIAVWTQSLPRGQQHHFSFNSS